MKNLSKYSIWLVLMLAIGLFASGCAESPFIDASDGEESGQILIEWCWAGDGDYTLKRAETPLPDDTWTEVYSGSETTFTDTDALTDTIYFYKVFRGSTASWPDGGYYGTVTILDKYSTNPLVAKIKLWERTNGCLHFYTNKLHPNPADDFPIDDTIVGSDGGSMDLEMALVAQDTLDAVAEFTFNSFKDYCSSSNEDPTTYTMNGYQYAPVDVANYDGYLWGHVDWGNGWQVYENVVVNKNTEGGHWYVGDTANGKARINYPIQTEGVCEDECDSEHCCP
ncbi:MAG: hypothetical protein U9P49_09980 [Thermodesulfobacteriota bacterium]|nr:hypothetical protein [Thermodesulfobacteriota bacterium]